jgi:hypothetical protein
MSDTKAPPAEEQGTIPENQSGQLNPSAPNDVNITPGTDYEQPKHPSKGERAQ